MVVTSTSGSSSAGASSAPILATRLKEIIGIWRDDQAMAFMYVLYRSGDPNCCPTGGGKIVRFRWNGKRVVALDRLPPSLSRTGVKLGR
jgi:hypothetical protein